MGDQIDGGGPFPDSASSLCHVARGIRLAVSIVSRKWFTQCGPRCTARSTSPTEHETSRISGKDDVIAPIWGEFWIPVHHPFTLPSLSSLSGGSGAEKTPRL